MKTTAKRIIITLAGATLLVGSLTPKQQQQVRKRMDKRGGPRF